MITFLIYSEVLILKTLKVYVKSIYNGSLLTEEKYFLYKQKVNEVKSWQNQCEPNTWSVLTIIMAFIVNLSLYK